MLQRCAVSLSAWLAFSVEGARVSRKTSVASKSKSLAGVPVLNYELAYEGHSKMSGREHWVVVAQKGISDERLKELCESSACERVGHPSKGGVPFFEVFCTESELEEVLFAAPGELEFVEPDGIVSLDPEEIGVASRTSWGLGRVGVPSRASAGAGVNIYVLDTGIRITHNEFAGRAAGAIDLTNNFVEECEAGDTSCAGDVQGHGTHCAGTAGGSTLGVASEAKIYAGKVLSDQGSGTWSWSYSALDWIGMTGRRPAIASMSLGGAQTSNAMRNAVDAAVASGVVVIVAAGNSNSDACGFSPAFVPSAITVGSTDNMDTRSSFSNYGSCVEIWAPGSNILSAYPNSDFQTRSLSGTSMACPHVSGGAALILEANPSLSPSQVLDQLTESANSGLISGLRNGDTNKLLWVGSGSAQPRPQCPDFATRPEPDSAGDCRCRDFGLCSVSGVTADCPTSLRPGSFMGRVFLATCEDCRCYETLG
jgi:subtilisin family serine protease